MLSTLKICEMMNVAFPQFAWEVDNIAPSEKGNDNLVVLGNGILDDKCQGLDVDSEV